MSRKLLHPTNRTLEGYTEEVQSSNEEFTFVQMADPQLGMWDLSLQNREWVKDLAQLNNAVEMINKLSPRPKFVSMCGDLTNAGPRSGAYEAQVKDFQNAVCKLHPDIAIICVCGNHDIENLPDRNSIAQWEKNFGDDYFVFWVNNTRFITLNSTLWLKGENAAELQTQQNDWLESVLSAPCSANHTVMFQHHPLFTSSIDEADAQWSSSSPINFPVSQRRAHTERLLRAGCRWLFAGHWHQSAVAHYDRFTCVTTNASGMPLCYEPSGFRVVRVTPVDITHQYVALEVQFPLDTEPLIRFGLLKPRPE